MIAMASQVSKVIFCLVALCNWPLAGAGGPPLCLAALRAGLLQSSGSVAKMANALDLESSGPKSLNFTRP